MPPLFHRAVDAVLFDMEGTILTSIKAAERVWTAWAILHGLDPVAFVPTIHGARAVDTVRKLGLPGVDPEVEAAAITEAEIADVGGVDAIAGAAEFLAALPAERWAVVTSAPRALAERRISAAGLPLPPTLVSAEEVVNGKPAPDGFLLGAKRLGVRPQRCLVLEDAPPGIAAAEAAGMGLIVITATHAHPVLTAHPTVRDYTRLRVTAGEGGAIVVSEVGG